MTAWPMSALEVVAAARAGDADAALEAASRIKLLAATRRGPFGLDDWSERIERAVASRAGGLKRGERWYVGRPILVTTNDRLTGVSNGDAGVVVARPAEDGTAEHGSDEPGDADPADEERDVALRLGGVLKRLPPARLDAVQTWWAMTIHRSQGSEFPEVIVSLPQSAASPILTRELLYTAITRSKSVVTLVATEEAIRVAVDRPVARASGLRDRLA